MKKNFYLNSKILLLGIFVVIIALFIFAFSSCKSTENKIRVGTLYGPTSIATNTMFGNTNDYAFTTLTDPSAIIGKIDAGDLDIALVPSNMAATLYNKEHNVKMISINNLCSIKVVSQDTSIKTTDDITNQKIYSTGEKNVIGAILGIISKTSNFNTKNANIIYKTNVEEVLSNVASDPKALGIVTQPQASLTARLNNNINEVLDISEQWHKIFGDNNNPVTAVAVVRNEFLENHKDKVDKFLNDEEQSINQANQNPAETAYTINKLTTKSENMYDATDILNSKVIFINGSKMKQMCDSFFKMIYDYDPSYIGNIIPEDDFYYINE